jgi:hypothetical protein
MVLQQPALWSLVRHPYVDATILSQAIEEQASQTENDYRSRLLIRDSMTALERHWGTHRFQHWLEHSPLHSHLDKILHEAFERPGFATLEHRVMDFTLPNDIEELFRAIGAHVRKPMTFHVGGSTALILPGLLARQTEDIDIVDEVPKPLRDDHRFRDEIKQKFGLEIAHFQSHYLPMRWENRTHWHGMYGELTVTLVDPIDVFLSKLFSIREKDYNDMKVLLQQLDKTAILDRLKRDCQSMLASESLKERATKNWYILTGETLSL